MSSKSADGAAVYSRFMLSWYDTVVLGAVSKFAWRCSRERMQDQYDRNVGASHLDLGPGTGYFLDHTGFPVPDPRLVLVDLNVNSLAATARRLERYRPVQLQRDVLEPLDLGDERFDSVGMNFLLHCLPGSFDGADGGKGVVFEHLLPYLNPGATVFGSTVVGDREAHANPLSRTQFWWLNKQRVFSNTGDRLADLESLLRRHFPHVQVTRVGAVALFEATVD
jgi:hypothetical protein